MSDLQSKIDDVQEKLQAKRQTHKESQREVRSLERQITDLKLEQRKAHEEEMEGVRKRFPSIL